MSPAEIQIQHDDAVCHIVIHRPERKNALTHTMYSAINDALLAAEANPRVRVIVLSGEGENFTSGNDLKDFLQHPPTDEQAPVMVMLNTLLNAQKPIVAAVSGYAIGIGTTLLMHCDLAYCDTTARFQLPFVSLGLCPEAGSSYVLPLMAGHRRAAELLLLGESFSPETAREIGLVNTIVLDEPVLAYAMRKAKQLAHQPYASVLLTKSLLKKPQQAVFSAHMRFEGQHFMERVTSPEALEAFSAFQEKRQPNFRPFDPA